MSIEKIELVAEPLTANSFAPFGDVIEADPSSEGHFSINDGAIERFNDLANIQNLSKDGRTLINIAICNRATPLPYHITFLERHPLGSQAFIPLCETPMIIAVAPPLDHIDPADIRAFISNGQQGINYHPNVWHMPMAPLKDNIKMIMIDSGNQEGNYEEFRFTDYKITLNEAGQA